MSTIDYIGLDIHKKTISFCAKAQDGTNDKVDARTSQLSVPGALFNTLETPGGPAP